MSFYKEQKVLVEGPLTNLKESLIQFAKPKKLINSDNPGSHFMTSSMFDAREALVPGSVYDRTNTAINGAANSTTGQYNYQRGSVPLDMFSRTHDPISYISPERAQAAMNNLPVPVGIFMNMAHIPPRFYNQHQQALQARQAQNTGVRNRKPLPGRQKGKGAALSQEQTQPFSQSLQLTQGMSQPGLSQPGFSLSQPGLSQAELSQDPYMAEYQSQMDGLLSQDSTYQGDRSGNFFQANTAQFSQPY